MVVESQAMVDRQHKWLVGVNFDSQGGHLGGQECRFWHPGDDFGDPGVSGDTWQDTLGPRPVFFLIWGGFRGVSGDLL